VASLAVVISLTLVVMEIRGNTLAVERQVIADHQRAIFTPFLSPEVLVSAINKIKAVDGHANYVQAFMTTYDMNESEAYVFTNFQLTIWADMVRDYTENGPSDRLAEQIRLLVRHPDVNLFLKHWAGSGVFSSYIESVRRDAEM
jgi:hypothetical protein